MGGVSRSIFCYPAKFPLLGGGLIILPLFYLVCWIMMLCFKCWFILPMRIFVSTSPPLQINLNIKPPAHQEVGSPSQIGIQSSSFAADAGLGLGIGLGCSLGPFGRPLPRVHVRVVVVFFNSGEEAHSSSSSAGAPPSPPRCGPCRTWQLWEADTETGTWRRRRHCLRQPLPSRRLRHFRCWRVALWGRLVALLRSVTSSRLFVASLVFSVVVSRTYASVLIFFINIMDINNRLVLLSPKMKLWGWIYFSRSGY